MQHKYRHVILFVLVVALFLFVMANVAEADQPELIFFGEPHSAPELKDNPPEPAQDSVMIEITISAEELDRLPAGHPPVGGGYMEMFLEDKCTFKAVIFEDMVNRRGPVEDADEELADALQDLQTSWEKHPNGIPHHEHVNNLRLTRDAYRLQGGEYRVKDAKDFGFDVYRTCMAWGF